MARPYGPRWRFRKAGLLPACLLFITLCWMPGAWAAPLRLLVLGDSLTAGHELPHADGFQAQLARALKARGYDVTIIDGAVSGATTAGGRSRIEWVLGDGADAAIVELGANDGLRAIDPKDTEANLVFILDTLAKHHVKVLLSGMYAPPNLGEEYGQAFRAVFDRLSRRPGLLYDPFFYEGVVDQPALLLPDHMHPNAEGVRHTVERLLPMVMKLLDEVGK